MDLGRIQQKFSQAEQSIRRAAQACEQDSSAPPQLRECLRDLDQRSKQAHEQILHPQDEHGIVRCVDELEEVGDRAKQAVQNYGNADTQLRIAVLEAHQHLSELKRQVH